MIRDRGKLNSFEIRSAEQDLLTGTGMAGIDVPVVKREPKMRRRAKEKEQHDDVNPQIEKLLTTIGIVACYRCGGTRNLCKAGGIFNLDPKHY